MVRLGVAAVSTAWLCGWAARGLTAMSWRGRQGGRWREAVPGAAGWQPWIAIFDRLEVADWVGEKATHLLAAESPA